MSARGSGLVRMVAVGLAVAGCGSGGAVRMAQRFKPPRRAERFKPPRTASLAAVQSFVNRTEQAPLHGRFTATYRISLDRYRGHVFRGRASVANWSFGALRFRETPGFSLSIPVTRAYEVLEGSGPYAISCSQARRDAPWFCISEKGEGMGGEFMQNGAIVPEAFNGGLSNAVAEYTQGAEPGTPEALFLSRTVVSGWHVRCLSFGNPEGDVGRVCTAASGLIVSYRLPYPLTDTYYASAELVSYSTKVNRAVLTPPAKPICPGMDRANCEP